MSSCGRDECPSHKYLEDMLSAKHDELHELTATMTSMQVQLGILMERLNGQDRLHARLDELQAKLDENSKLLWKAVGMAVAVSFSIPFTFKFIFH